MNGLVSADVQLLVLRFVYIRRQTPQLSSHLRNRSICTFLAKSFVSASITPHHVVAILAPFALNAGHPVSVNFSEVNHEFTTNVLHT